MLNNKQQSGYATLEIRDVKHLTCDEISQKLQLPIVQRNECYDISLKNCSHVGVTVWKGDEKSDPKRYPQWTYRTSEMIGEQCNQLLQTIIDVFTPRQEALVKIAKIEPIEIYVILSYDNAHEEKEYVIDREQFSFLASINSFFGYDLYYSVDDDSAFYDGSLCSATLMLYPDEHSPQENALLRVDLPKMWCLSELLTEFEAQWKKLNLQDKYPSHYVKVYIENHQEIMPGIDFEENNVQFLNQLSASVYVDYKYCKPQDTHDTANQDN